MYKPKWNICSICEDRIAVRLTTLCVLCEENLRIIERNKHEPMPPEHRMRGGWSGRSSCLGVTRADSGRVLAIHYDEGSNPVASGGSESILRFRR